MVVRNLNESFSYFCNDRTNVNASNITCVTFGVRTLDGRTLIHAPIPHEQRPSADFMEDLEAFVNVHNNFIESGIHVDRESPAFQAQLFELDLKAIFGTCPWCCSPANFCFCLH